MLRHDCLSPHRIGHAGFPPPLSRRPSPRMGRTNRRRFEKPHTFEAGARNVRFEREWRRIGIADQTESGQATRHSYRNATMGSSLVARRAGT